MISITQTRRAAQQSPERPDSPTIVLLHGAGSNEDDLVGLLPADLQLNWASLREPFDHAASGASWFTARRPYPPDPAEVAASTRAIWSWIDHELGEESTLIPVGFSQGGFMVTQLLRTRPERLVASAILSGLILGDDNEQQDLPHKLRPPAFWGRGANDHIVTTAHTDLLRAYLERRTALEEHVYPALGHGISADETRDLAGFIRRAIHPPSRASPPPARSANPKWKGPCPCRISL